MTSNNGTLVYVLAASHSGSTLTAMLLNSHPNICTAGELKISSLDDPDTYRCSCRKLICRCEFWQSVAVAMQDRGLQFDVLNARTNLLPTRSAYINRLLRPLHRGPIFESTRDFMLNRSSAWPDVNREWQHRNKSLVDSICEVANVRFVVDSSKTAVRLKFLRRIPGLDVKVIRLVRDGRAVSLTYMDSDNYADAKDPQLRGGGTGPTDRPNLSMKEAATRWLKSNADADAVSKTLSSDEVIQISYEELCANPGMTLQKVHSFLGIENDDSHTDFRAASHHVIGNGMRLDSTSEIVLDDRWKAQLSQADLEMFESTAGQLNRRYGYGLK